jgi:hypothetical protein
MLALNCSFLNMKYIHINVLRILALIISVCILQVTLLLKITPRYFTLFTSGIFHPFVARWGSRGPHLMDEIALLGMSYIFQCFSSHTMSPFC